jgi:hypothetical protein
MPALMAVSPRPAIKAPEAKKQFVPIPQQPVVKTKPGTFPNRGSAEIHGVRKRIGKIVGENSWARRREQAQAGFEFMRPVVGVKDVNRRNVVVFVTLLSIRIHEHYVVQSRQSRRLLLCDPNLLVSSNLLISRGFSLS